ncbi:MAG: hypothetical protein PHS59_07300 [Paludibacter sp.]|nr:hypothetical protein [Paludibacter sp.]
MKKNKQIFYLAVAILFYSIQLVNAQTYFNDYAINENFETGVAGSVFNWGLSGNFGTNSKCANAATGQIAGIIYGKSLDTYGGSVSASISGVKTLEGLKLDSQGRLWLDFDWQVNNGQSLYASGNGGYIYFKDTDGNIILGFNVAKDDPGSTGSYLHLLNLNNTIVDVPDAAATSIIPTSGTGSFARTNQWVHIHAVLNFNSKKIDTLVIHNNTAKYENYSLSFHNNTAGMLSEFELRFKYSGSNASKWRPQLDNFKIYRIRESLGLADVSLKFQDQNGEYFKVDSIFTGQQIGTRFIVPANLLKTERINGFDYIFDAVNSVTTIDSIVGNTTLNLKFNKVSTASVKLRFIDQHGTFFKQDSVFANLQVGSKFTIPVTLSDTMRVGNYYYTPDYTTMTGIDNIVGDSTLVLLYNKKYACTVTVRFQDEDNKTIKPDEVFSNLFEGDSFITTSSQKASVVTDSYYTLNPILPSGISLLEGDTTLVLIYIKSPIVNGTYVWSGVINNNWNETEKNFLINDSPTAYQTGNSVLFNNLAGNTTVNLAMNAYIDGTATVNAPGYEFAGSGELSGFGTFNVDLTSTDQVTLNIKNHLEGGIQVSGGIVELKNAAAAKKLRMADNTKLVWNTNTNMGEASNKLPISTLDGSTEISINTVAAKEYYALIENATTLNIAIGNAESTGETFVNFDGTTFPVDLHLNASNLTGGTSRLGIGRTNPTKKIHLGSGVALGRGATTYGDLFTIGELSGETGSFIDGTNNRISATNRDMRYQIGGLNTDATFNGIIRAYQGKDSLNSVFVEKVGSGTWTLSAQHTFYKGYFHVDAGKVVFAGGGLHDSIPLAVAANATLSTESGKCSVTKVGKTLELDDNAVLTMEINPSESNSDMISATRYIKLSGTLNLINIGGELKGGEEFQLFQATDSIVGSFTEIQPVLPVGLQWDITKLDSEGLLKVTNISATNSLLCTKDILNVEYFDIRGVKLKLTNKFNPNRGNFQQIIFKKTTFTNGEMKIEKIVIK